MSADELVATFEGHCSATKACPGRSCPCGDEVKAGDGAEAAVTGPRSAEQPAAPSTAHTSAPTDGEEQV